MAKGSRGGQRAGGATSGGGSVQPSATVQMAQQQPAQQTNVQVDNTSTASDFSTDYNKFMAMTDDEKADVISKAVSQGVPPHLSDTDFQKFIYHSGLNDKPDVVDDATLDKMNGTELFRTVNASWDKKNDISYDADQIGKQIIAGKVTRTSDTGGSRFGRGIYFANDRFGSTLYGDVRGDVKKTAVIRAKLNNNAKIGNYNTLLNDTTREMGRGSKLGKVLSKVDIKSAVSIYAMTRGYNVISGGNGYFCVLNRNAITASSAIKPV